MNQTLCINSIPMIQTGHGWPCHTDAHQNQYISRVAIVDHIACDSGGIYGGPKKLGLWACILQVKLLLMPWHSYVCLQWHHKITWKMPIYSTQGENVPLSFKRGLFACTIQTWKVYLLIPYRLNLQHYGVGCHKLKLLLTCSAAIPITGEQYTVPARQCLPI